MGCCGGKDDRGNLNIISAKKKQGAEFDEEFAGQSDNIFMYVDKAARSKFKEIGPYEPPGYSEPNKDLVDSPSLIEENGFVYKGKINSGS